MASKMLSWEVRRAGEEWGIVGRGTEGEGKQSGSGSEEKTALGTQSVEYGAQAWENLSSSTRRVYPFLACQWEMGWGLQAVGQIGGQARG